MCALQVRSAGLVRKEATLKENERAKLAPLGLLVERLAGPALQVAKRLGLDELAGEDGEQQLLTALEKQLMPLKKQAATELYHAGSMREGVLSRQQGESMASYCLSRPMVTSKMEPMRILC